MINKYKLCYAWDLVMVERQSVQDFQKTKEDNLQQLLYKLRYACAVKLKHDYGKGWKMNQGSVKMSGGIEA